MSSTLGTHDFASDLLEAPELPVSLDEATHVSPMNDVTAQAQVLGVTAEPTSISLDEIREVQSVDNSRQPVIQALTDKVKPPQVICVTTPKRLVPSSHSGIRLSWRIMSCTGVITILTAPISICKWCCLSN